MELSRRAVVVDRWDASRCAVMADELPQFAAEGRALRDLVDVGADELWADFFALFDKVSPALTPAAAMDPALALNHAVVATALRQPELARIQVWTQGDAVASAMACVAMRRCLETLYDRAQVHRRMALGLDELRAMLAQAIDQEVSDQNAVAELMAAIAAEETAVAAREAQDQAERMMTLRSALGRVAVEAEEAGDMARMVGGRDDLMRLPAQVRLDLAKRMNTPAFRQMADLFGAMDRLLGAAMQTQVADVPDDIGELEYGRDLSRVAPVALMALADPVTEDRFYLDYLEGRLPQAGRRGSEQAARGGVVCAVDNSISMAGEHEQLAKAVALTLLHLCRRQGRPFHGLHFSSRHQLLDFDFAPPYGVDMVLDFAEFYFGGGTDFMAPLDRGVTLLEAERRATGGVRADLVIVTDGEAGVTARWRAQWLERMGLVGGRCWGLLVGGGPQWEPLRGLCRETGGAAVRILDALRPGVDLGRLFAQVAA